MRAPIVSFRRMEVHFGSDKRVVISPAAEKDFLEYIIILNPNIKIYLKNENEEHT